jgi:adenylate cyclase
VKRSSIAALAIGALVSAIIIALHATRLLAPLEEGFLSALAGGQPPTKVVSSGLQSLLIILLSIGVAWLVITSSRRKKLHWPLAVLGIELLLISWICLLYQVAFQPLPSVFALALGFAGANGYIKYGRTPAGVTRDLFGGRISEEQLGRIAAGELNFDSEAKSYETTAVVCDIANKHDLAEECSPAQLAEVTEKFIAHATESFLKAGAYIESVTGEGIVALFGFPGEDSEQAERATRHALALLESFEKLREGRDSAFNKLGVHFGISSGTSVITPLQRDDRKQLLATGEPIELARRFCIANRFYGSRILMGPRTFELASKAVVARPIDFLSGVDVRERHEIYEPLRLATEATPEEIARRDSFWNGVVLYREKRWAEAYSQFQKARGPNEQEDAPLQLYVRRLEPLALHLSDSPMEYERHS